MGDSAVRGLTSVAIYVWGCSGYLVLNSTPDPFSPYLSFFSLFPLISHSCFWPPNSAAPFPLSLSPSIVSLYSTVNWLSINFRSAEKVSVPSFSFRSLRLVSFWSGQLIVPASLSPSFLIVKGDAPCWAPISYSHFHAPPGSAFSPCAPPRPQTPRTTAAERIRPLFAAHGGGRPR